MAVASSDKMSLKVEVQVISACKLREVCARPVIYRVNLIAHTIIEVTHNVAKAEFVSSF